MLHLKSSAYPLASELDKRGLYQRLIDIIRQRDEQKIVTTLIVRTSDKGIDHLPGHFHGI
jgi:hypothetical protein